MNSIKQRVKILVLRGLAHAERATIKVPVEGESELTKNMKFITFAPARPLRTILQFVGDNTYAHDAGASAIDTRAQNRRVRPA